MVMRQLRKSLHKSQSEFWTPFRVTQSGGSRYEAGREMPAPLKLLFQIAQAKNLRAVKRLVNPLREAVGSKKI